MAFSSHNNSLCKCNLVLFRPASANADCCTPLFWFEVIVAAMWWMLVTCGGKDRLPPAMCKNAQPGPKKKCQGELQFWWSIFLIEKSHDPQVGSDQMIWDLRLDQVSTGVDAMIVPGSGLVCVLSCRWCSQCCRSSIYLRWKNKPKLKVWTRSS